MNAEFDQLLDADTQSDLADEIVAATAAVVAEAQAPDFAARALTRAHETNLRPEQIQPAAALQAYGVQQAGTIFAAALAGNPVAHADALRQLLSDACGDERLQALQQDERSAIAFKSRLHVAIAVKAADLVAAELLRGRQAPLAIDDPANAEIFRRTAEAQHERHVALLTDYLRELPQRHAELADRILPTLAQEIRDDIADRYQSTEIRHAIDDILNQALGDAANPAGPAGASRTTATGAPGAAR